MIKIYGMDTCPDCTYLHSQVEGNENYQMVDIGAHVKNLKEFLALRDNNSLFDECKKRGAAGIPCFLKEDGTVTLTPEDVGLISRPKDDVVACSIDGKGC
ncbi:MAG: glutaredoxin-related protein [Lachnospiraceae bacterium]|nr:glutaredoxin-related protein [Lachnospiraceae bacterium]